MSEHLVSTRALIQTCPRCGGLLLSGIAEGIHARTDITPITNEAAAIQAGRWTYTLTAGELVYRDDFRRSRPPAGPLLADHDCPNRPITQGELW